MISRSFTLGRTLFARTICTTAVKMDHPPSLIKLKKLQAHFQADDGKLVWQKGGFKDRVLYMSTWILIGIALPVLFSTLWDFMKPPQWKEKKE